MGPRSFPLLTETRRGEPDSLGLGPLDGDGPAVDQQRVVHLTGSVLGDLPVEKRLNV